MIIPTSVKGIVGRGGLLLKNHSPEILTGVGIAGMVVGAVLGAKATLNLEPIIDDHEENLEILNNIKDIDQRADKFNQNTYLRDKAGIYARTSLKLVKLYGPSVSLIGGGAVSIIAGHGILAKRNVALVAAYKTVETAYSEYRKRVIEEFGEEKDRDYRYGTTEETLVNPETGKKTKVVKANTDPNKLSGYAKFFDESNKNWQRDPEYNLMFLRAKQNYANDRLLATGHLFLNEIYDDLGFEHTRAGAVVGWIVSENSDNYVDFGIFNPENEQGRKFVNGDERSIILDFNVDGPILGYFKD